MLQSLLADRFKMVVRHETREMPIYALVVANPKKLGPQIHEYSKDLSRDVSCAGIPNQSLDEGIGAQAPETVLSTLNSQAEMAAADLRYSSCSRVVGGFLAPSDHNQVWAGGKRVSMDAIAAAVGSMIPIDRPVINHTDLSGDFDFIVEWDSRNDWPASGRGNIDQTGTIGASFFEAARDQLGLKFESTKGLVDVIVIDHVEQPKQD